MAGAVEDVADNLFAQADLACLDTGALVKEGQPGMVLLGSAAEPAGDLHAFGLGKDTVWNGGADAEDGEALEGQAGSGGIVIPHEGRLQVKRKRKGQRQATWALCKPACSASRRASPMVQAALTERGPSAWTT